MTDSIDLRQMLISSQFVESSFFVAVPLTTRRQTSGKMHEKRSKQVRIRTSTLPYLVAREKSSATKREIDWKES